MSSHNNLPDPFRRIGLSATTNGTEYASFHILKFATITSTFRMPTSRFIRCNLRLFFIFLVRAEITIFRDASW